METFKEWFLKNATKYNKMFIEFKGQKFKESDSLKFSFYVLENNFFDSDLLKSWVMLEPADKDSQFRTAAAHVLRPPQSEGFKSGDQFKNISLEETNNYGSELLEYIYSNTIPVNVVGDTSKYETVFFDVKQKAIHPFTWKNFCLYVPDIKVQREIRKNAVAARLNYAPHQPFCTEDLLTGRNFADMAVLNTYTAPEWRFIEDAEPKIHPKLDAFLSHLFPELRHRDYVLNWIYKSLQGPVEQHLVLIGAQDTGKSTLVTGLMRALHGESNYTLLNKSALKDKFNGDLLDSTLALYDEAVVSSYKELEILKSWADAQVSVELKGLDAQTVMRTTSLVFVANSYSFFKINPITSRKFGFPDVTSDKLVAKFGPDWVDELHEVMGDPQVLAEFYAYLKAHPQASLMQRFKGSHKGTHYQAAIYNASTSHIKSMIDTVRSKKQEAYTPTELQKKFFSKNLHNEYNHNPYQIQDIKTLFEEYKEDGKIVARVDVAKGLIYPVEKYMPDKSEMESDGI